MNDDTIRAFLLVLSGGFGLKMIDAISEAVRGGRKMSMDDAVAHRTELATQLDNALKRIEVLDGRYIEAVTELAGVRAEYRHCQERGAELEVRIAALEAAA